MYTKQALHELGIKTTVITEEQKRQLDAQGFFIVENALSQGARRDLPQQLVQIDHLTQGLYDRMSPVHRYLMEIEPPDEGGVLRQKKRDHNGWWN